MAFTTQQRSALRRFLANKTTDEIVDFMELAAAERLTALRAFIAGERATMTAQRESMAASLAEFDALIATLYAV